MMCQWKALMNILPLWLQQEIRGYESMYLLEIRLRINAPSELIFDRRIQWGNRNVVQSDLCHVVNTASQYSPWTAVTQSQGYITAPGGHRIGICGDMVVKNGEPAGFHMISSVCLRIARDFQGIGKGIDFGTGSTIILGAPGWGKTTLLRDCSRQIGATETIAVVDERKELFPEGFSRGKRMDVLTGAPKVRGMEMILRTMGPQWIAVDEITAKEDTDACRHLIGCGIKLLASAHASSMEDFKKRPVYQPLWKEGIFKTALILRKDRSFIRERITI